MEKYIQHVISVEMMILKIKNIDRIFKFRENNKHMLILHPIGNEFLSAYDFGCFFFILFD